jgi:hypothetical protein
MKYLIYLLVLIPTLLWADMIEITDDDRHQYLEFSNCSPDSIDSIIVGVQIDPDSGYWEIASQLIDTVFFVQFGFISPDRDSSDNVIPGHYAGEYWFYTISVLPNGDHVLPEDTTHVMVDYTISIGCGGLFHVD